VPEVITGTQPGSVSGASLTLAAGTTVAQTMGTQAVKNLTIGENVTFERSGTTSADDYTLFGVSGTLALPSAATLSLLSLPDGNAKLFTYGTDSGNTSWAISGENTRTCTVIDSSADRAIWLIRTNGTLLRVQ